MPRPNNDQEGLAQSRGEHALARLRRRDAPKFFIVNPNGDVEFASPNLVDSELLRTSKRLVEGLIGAAGLTHQVCEGLGADMALRVVPLAGVLRGYVAAFIEGSRNSLAVASERYNLTKRESEVLACILKGFSTTRIARTLVISEGTVSEHVQNIFRKVGTKSRPELVIRILDRETEPLT
jgi:DNA-binding CsgD family transcriptional regulator